MFEDKLYIPGNTRWSERPNYFPLKNSEFYVCFFISETISGMCHFFGKEINLEHTFAAAISLNQKVTEIDIN